MLKTILAATTALTIVSWADGACAQTQIQSQTAVLTRPGAQPTPDRKSVV